MGTKYGSGVAISGYNASPPPDDASTGSDNQLEWGKHISKIGNPLKTAVEAINTALTTTLDQSARSTSSTTTAIATDHNRTIEIASTVTAAITISLSDAATMAEGYVVNVHNLSAVQYTLARVTAGDLINGVASNVPIAAYSTIKAWVNAAENGYLVSQQNNASSGGVRGNITLATEQATTSGTSKDFTGIPVGVKRITVMFSGVSTSGTSQIMVQLGDSGGVEATGYTGACGGSDGTAITTTLQTTGFVVTIATIAARAYSGTLVLNLQNSSSFSWVASSIMTPDDTTAQVQFGSGRKSLSAMLDRVRITTQAGSDTFDAGAVNISYE